MATPSDRVEDGLPVNSINAPLQSFDGCIWVAALNGLVRFDEARFNFRFMTNAVWSTDEAGGLEELEEPKHLSPNARKRG